MSTLRTVHPVNHIDYGRDTRVDHLFIIGMDHEAILLTVSDTGLDLVLDSTSEAMPSQGFSLTWADLVAAVKSGVVGHNGVVGLTTESVIEAINSEQEQA